MGAYTVTGQRARQMRVVPAEVLKRLYARSDRHGLVQTAAHVALLVAGGWLVLATRGTWWVAPALLVQGIFINSLFGAMHESVHYGSFKTRWMADVLAFFSGAAILNNAGFYRHYHMAHHRYTQDPARDPELVTSGTPKTWGQYLFRVSSIPFLMLRVRDIFLFPFGYRGDVDYIHPSAWPEVRRWGRWLLALYAALIVGSIALQTTVVLWAWFIPLLVGLPFLRLYLLCEHTLCPNSDDGFANTRTTVCNPLLRFLMLRVRDIFLFPFGYRGDVDYIHPSAWPEVRRWGRWLLALYAALIVGSIALQTTVVLWAWFIPLLVGLPFLRLYLLCEHTLCPNSDDGFANTRTTLSNPIVRFLMWNLPYHAEHHLFPNIAFHNLPEAHRHLRPHLKYVAKGYIQVQREIVRSLA